MTVRSHMTPCGHSGLATRASVSERLGDVNAVLQELAQLGVSKRTLFPDLAGLADFVRWKHFHKVGGYNLESGG